MYVCMSKLSKFVFATAIQLQPKNIKVKEKKSYPHRPTAREGTYILSNTWCRRTEKGEERQK